MPSQPMASAQTPALRLDEQRTAWVLRTLLRNTKRPSPTMGRYQKLQNSDIFIALKTTFKLNHMRGSAVVYSVQLHNLECDMWWLLTFFNELLQKSPSAAHMECLLSNHITCSELTVVWLCLYVNDYVNMFYQRSLIRFSDKDSFPQAWNI